MVGGGGLRVYPEVRGEKVEGWHKGPADLERSP